VVPSFVVLVGSLVLGAVLHWDVRGYATRSRQRFEARALDGALYRKLPAWTFRAFGVWCFVFGIGQFVAFYLRRR
jgi:hypothetical protein